MRKMLMTRQKGKMITSSTKSQIVCHASTPTSLMQICFMVLEMHPPFCPDMSYLLVINLCPEDFIKFSRMSRFSQLVPQFDKILNVHAACIMMGQTQAAPSLDQIRENALTAGTAFSD